MSPDIKIDDKELRRAMKEAPAKTKTTIRRILFKGATLTQREARIEAPVHDGEYRRSISMEVGKESAVVRPKANYSPYIEYGTKPHFPPIIEGQGIAKWSRDHGLDPFLVARSISRKGTKANPVFERTLKKVKKPIERIAEREISALVRLI